MNRRTFRRLLPVAMLTLLLLGGVIPLGAVGTSQEAVGIPVPDEPVDHPCIDNPTFPPNCVDQLGAIGEPPVSSAIEGFLNIASPVVDPLLLVNGLLYAVNPFGNLVRVIDPTDMSTVADIPTCYRPSALAATQDGSRVLVSCHASDAVGVIDTATQRMVAAIQDRDADGRPVLQEPMGIAVAGDTAWVASSQNQRIGVLDLVSLQVVGYHDVPGQDPRSIALTPDGQFLVVANFLAGNRTEPNMLFNASILDPASGNFNQACADALADPVALAVALENEPTFMDTSHPDYALIAECYFFAHTFGGSNTVVVSPFRTDHDLVVLRTSDGQVVFSTDVLAEDVGTLNYGVTMDPSGQHVYLSTVHARNSLNSGFGNRPLVNRLVVLDLDPATGALTVSAGGIRDLDAPFLDAGGAGTSLAATPYAVEVAGPRVLVTAAGSDTLVLADKDGNLTGTVAVGFTPKGVVGDGAIAYVYNATGLTVSKVDLDAASVVGTQSIGPNALSQEERIGAHLMNSAHFSSNNTFACASCHPDGHLDGLVWKLNDADNLRTTMTLQEIAETAPYHWDGAKCNLVKILQDGIVNLFGNPAGPSDCEMETMIGFMDGLVRPHSPHRALDDSMTDDSKLGGAIIHLANFSDLADEGLACNGRAQNPAVEGKYLAEIGDPFNTRFQFNGGGGPVPNTLVAETCGVANCHVTPHWESFGFRDGDPAQGLIDGFQAVSFLGNWDRMVTTHDAHTTRAKFIEATETNRAFHGAQIVNPGDNYTGVLASQAFNDTHFRHPEYNFDGDPATHAFTLTDRLTSFIAEEEELQTGAAGLTVILTGPGANDTESNTILQYLQSAADQGKIALRGVGLVGGQLLSVIWDSADSAYQSDEGDTMTEQELKVSLGPGDSMMLYGGLLPGQGNSPNPKLKSVSRADPPYLCSEGYAEYHASLGAGETDVQLVLNGIDVVSGSRVMVDGVVAGAALSGTGPDFAWTLPLSPATPTVLAIQVLGPTGMQSNSIVVPVVGPVVNALEPAPVIAGKLADLSVELTWPDQFGLTGPGTRYDVFRGSIGDLGQLGLTGGACFASALNAPRATDGGTSNGGEGFFYVVRAQNQAGFTTWGTAKRDADVGASSSPCGVLFP